jgi:hypothetical protein
MIPFLLAAVGGYLIGDSMKESQTFADGGRPIQDVDYNSISDLEGELRRLYGIKNTDSEIKQLKRRIEYLKLLPKEKMLSLLKKTKFKTFDSSEIQNINYYISDAEYSKQVEINANPCKILIYKYDDDGVYYVVSIGKNSGSNLNFPYYNWDYIFEIPTINYQEFEKGLNKVVSDNRVVLYREKYGELKFYFVGSLEDAIEFAQQNGYKKVNDKWMMYGMYFSNGTEGLKIGTFTDRQIEDSGVRLKKNI